MANKPMRPCRYPGCRQLTNQGYCPQHKPQKTRRQSAQWHWLYDLPLWRDALRPRQLLQEPWCRQCAKEGRRVRAAVVDHIRPHRGDWALFTNPDNLQSLCKSCHDRKTAREIRRRTGE